MKIKKNAFLLKNNILDKLSGRLNKFETISLVGSQLHELDIISSLDKFFLLADGASVKLSEDKQSNNTLGSVANQWVCNPVFACIFKGSYTHLGTGVVFLPRVQKYFLETSWGWGKYRTLNLKKFGGSKTTIKANCPVYVFSSVGYHGVVEDLAAILLLLDQGIEFSIVLDADNTWMRNLVELFLPDSVERFYIKGNVWISADSTISVTKSAFGEFVNPTLIKKLNDVAKKITPHQESKNIFISRPYSTARYSNVESLLEKKFIGDGFDKVDLAEMTVKDQVSLFRSAKKVVGMHGAGFVNLAWSNPGVVVLEFYFESHFNSCYSALSHLLGHHYGNKCVKNLESI